VAIVTLFYLSHQKYTFLNPYGSTVTSMVAKKKPIFHSTSFAFSEIGFSFANIFVAI